MRRLMKYYIVSGRTVEERRSYFQIGEAPKKQRGTRRVGASTEKKIRANEKSSMLNLARTINCNFQGGDGFLTLKYDEEHYPDGEDVYQEAKRILTKKFLPELGKKYRKETGKKLKAVWVTANWSIKRQSPARIHHHIVVPADAVDMAKELWHKRGGIGTVWTRELTNEGDYTKLASYMMDNVKGRPAGENKWSGCRGMEKPTYCGWEEVRDVEDVQPLPGSIVKDVTQYQDEDGHTVSAYLRCVLPARVKIRSGQIVLPRKRRREARA